MSNELDDLRAELRSLTVEQLADAMGIEKWRVYELVRSDRRRPVSKLERRTLFRLQDCGSGDVIRHSFDRLRRPCSWLNRRPMGHAAKRKSQTNRIAIQPRDDPHRSSVRRSSVQGHWDGGSLDEGPPLDSIVAGDRAATAPWSIAKPLSADARAGEHACAILRHDASKPC